MLPHSLQISSLELELVLKQKFYLVQVRYRHSHLQVVHQTTIGMEILLPMLRSITVVDH